VMLTIQPEQAAEWTVALRIPDWSRGKAVMRVNGQEMVVEDITEDGYAYVKRAWAPGDTVELAFSMEIHQVRANPNIRGNAGKAAIQRGPLVYCLESVDHGAPVSSLSLAGDPKLHSRFDPDLLGGAVVIEGDGWLEESDDWGDEL
ncbi:glycoside hydrolase family 127 protein, partial [Clostridium perfringens]